MFQFGQPEEMSRDELMQERQLAEGHFQELMWLMDKVETITTDIDVLLPVYKAEMPGGAFTQQLELTAGACMRVANQCSRRARAVRDYLEMCAFFLKEGEDQADTVPEELDLNANGGNLKEGGAKG